MTLIARELRKSILVCRCELLGTSERADELASCSGDSSTYLENYHSVNLLEHQADVLASALYLIVS